MRYLPPTVHPSSSKSLVRNEVAWWIGLALIFAVCAFAKYEETQAIQECSKQGGLKRVYTDGVCAVSKVECYEPKKEQQKD